MTPAELEELVRRVLREELAALFPERFEQRDPKPDKPKPPVDAPKAFQRCLRQLGLTVEP